MIEIFRKSSEISTGVVKPPSWPYVSKAIKDNVKVVEDYYRKNVRPVKSDHFLVRLLQSINVSKTLPLMNFYTAVDAMAMNHSMAMKLTSSIYKGTVFRGEFYGGVIPEVIIATDETFDVEEVDRNWKDVCAVKPLLHPKSDLRYLIPNGTQYTKEYGLAVLLINIPMLAVQYRAFLNNEMLVRPDAPYDIKYFIGAYVLPNMVRHNLDIAIFNRLFNKVTDQEFDEDISFRHPFALTNYTPHLDKVLDSVVENISRSSKSYRTVFASIPSVYNDNFFETLILPHMLETKQVSWALVVSRLRMINFLIKVAGEEAKIKNMFVLTQVVNSLAESSTFRMIQEMLPVDIFFSVENDVEEILESIGKNKIQ